VNESKSATPRVNDFCASALHDTRNSTFPSDVGAACALCSSWLALLPSGSSRQKAPSNVIALLPAFFTLELLTEPVLPIMVVPPAPLGQSSGGPFHSIALLTPLKWNIRAQNLVAQSRTE
jgi:hypothetical protein